MFIVSMSYFADSFGNFIFDETYKSFSDIVLIPAVIGELSFTFWLIFKGIKDIPAEVISRI